ncbi:MAG: hypothetical protein K2H03_10015 [Muribaculaceae bacterium]|nr:hypothetical protein [Muribaculaceae bacterium]MDE5930804.1 hypothetical protein [Muribaculaceae bacterium]
MAEEAEKSAAAGIAHAGGLKNFLLRKLNYFTIFAFLFLPIAYGFSMDD